MTEIIALLQSIASTLSNTMLRQVIFGSLVVSGHITMLDLSHWTEKGRRYRTI
jgi:hypothetical protein